MKKIILMVVVGLLLLSSVTALSIPTFTGLSRAQIIDGMEIRFGGIENEQEHFLFIYAWKTAYLSEEGDSIVLTPVSYDVVFSKKEIKSCLVAGGSIASCVVTPVKEEARFVIKNDLERVLRLQTRLTNTLSASEESAISSASYGGITIN